MSFRVQEIEPARAGTGEPAGRVAHHFAVGVGRFVGRRRRSAVGQRVPHPHQEPGTRPAAEGEEPRKVPSQTQRTRCVLSFLFVFFLSTNFNDDVNEKPDDLMDGPRSFWPFFFTAFHLKVKRSRIECDPSSNGPQKKTYFQNTPLDWWRFLLLLLYGLGRAMRFFDDSPGLSTFDTGSSDAVYNRR